MMVIRSTLLCACLVAIACGALASAQSAETSDPGIAARRGLVVHLGAGDGRKTAELGADPHRVVHGLEGDATKVEAARRTIAARGLYGRVSVDAFDGQHLPYVDNLVDLLIADDLGQVTREEVLRVLAPLGIAMIGRERIVKPYPAELDEWPQYLHGADNNAVSRDREVGPPRHLQWVDRPNWSRSHMSIPSVMSLVTARGRTFSIEDRATPEHPFLPGRAQLVARSAGNGVVLWERAFPDWEPITRYVKDIAVQLQRRLAAIGDVVYCTPGLNAPLTAFDAATGETIRDYAGTAGTQEFAWANGVLFVVVGDRMNAARYDIVKAIPGKGTSLGGYDLQAPFDGAGFRGAYGAESQDREDPLCSILALDAESGQQRWRTADLHGYIGCTLAVRGDRAVYQTNNGMACLNARTGETLWSVEKRVASADGTEANTVILTDRTVYAQEGNTLVAYSLDDGRQKWSGRIANNYEKSADLFFVDGAVWTGGSEQPTCLDAETGETIKTLTQRMTGPMGHDRCYRNFITETFFINSKTGGADFVDLATGAEFPQHWTRGTCGMGVLPANGLIYVPPYSCQCSVGAMLQGFLAMRSAHPLTSPDQEFRVERSSRLVQGPAFGSALSAAEDLAAEWPTYRRDGSRGGATQERVSSRLKPLWSTRLSAAPSAPVIASGRVFVAEVDAHAVSALDAGNGELRWRYTAGGRIDSPPSVYRDFVLFGSRDGWVYCLRAADGELVWRFRDLPDRRIGAYGQLESVWPVHGSVLIAGGKAYFAAGRSSFLDGGIFLYALDPATGEVLHSRQIYGPFAEGTGFPATDQRGCKADVLVSDGELLYLRQRAFRLDLEDAVAGKPHVLPSAGFLDGTPQHRTYWTIASGFQGTTTVAGAQGDILATDGERYFEMRGFPVHRHSYFDPRVQGYRLVAGVIGDASDPASANREVAAKRRRGQGDGGNAGKRSTELWSHYVPLTGRAMVLAGDVVFVAGTPAYFPPDHPVEKYEAAYEGHLGGLLWAAATADGGKLAEYVMDAEPVWDGLAAAGGRLYVSLRDGSVVCYAGE